MITNIEVTRIRQNVSSRARVMVFGVCSDLGTL